MTVLLTISGVKRLERTVHFFDSHNQVIGRNIANKIRKEIDCVVAAVENRAHDAILTAMDSVVIPRVEMAVKSMTGLSERGRNSVSRNPYHREFSGNMAIRPLRAASSRMDSIINQDRNDETGNCDNFEDAELLALKSNYAGKTHTLHRYFSVTYR